MLTQLEELEIKKTAIAYHKGQERIRRFQGPGIDDYSAAIADRYLNQVIDAVPAAIERLSGVIGPLNGLRYQLLRLSAPVIALGALQGTLHSIGRKAKFGVTLKTLGGYLEVECYSAGLTSFRPKLHKVIGDADARKKMSPKAKAKAVEKATQHIQEYAKRLSPSVSGRRRLAQRMAERIGYQMVAWSPADLARAGGWMLDLVLGTLPDVFMIEGGGEDKKVTITDEAHAFATAIVDGLLFKNRRYLPMAQPPVPWSDLTGGGAYDRITPRQCSLVRTRHKDTKAAMRAACKDATMLTALAGLNALQGVPFRINTRVLGVLRECVAREIQIKGLPAKWIDPPAKEQDWDTMSDREKGVWLHTTRKAHRHNLSLKAERLMLTEDIGTADLIAAGELYPGGRFYTPMNMDWRGRTYALTQFNFQRDDRVRALFLFDRGEPIGEDGLRWLKINVANTAGMKTDDGRKSSKLTMDERVAWTDQNISRLEQLAAAPLRETWWREADKPFLFLAAVFELISAMAGGPTYISRLPVSFDGSCSGLQHLTAMTRADEGSLVNLTPQSIPADVYQTVALSVQRAVQADALSEDWAEGDEWRSVVARLALAYGIDRSMVKRNVMTYSYSSKRFGMANQQQEDLMDALDEEVLTGRRAVHPFSDFARGRIDRPSRASRYLADHIYTAIEQIVTRPAEAMRFLQKLAKTLAHEGKPLRWTTPTGLPWINRYHQPTLDRIELWMFDRGVRVRQRVLVATGDQHEIDKAKVAAGVAPNFVHALDAAHLAMVAQAAAAEGIEAATVHDSFGCLASRATRFNAIIREQFVRMYTEHDVLREVLEQARRDLTPHNHKRLPELPAYGDLKLEDVKNATFAFA